MSESLTITLRDLVASGCISKCTFVFNHERGNGINLEGITNLRCVNAAKLSLLLAQTWGRFHDNDESGIDPITVNLDNFFVKLACSSISSEFDGATFDKAFGESREEDNLTMESNDVHPLDFKMEPFEFDDNERSLGFIADIFDINEDGPKQDNTESTSFETSEETSSELSCRDQNCLSSDKVKFDNINAASERADICWTILGMEIQVCGASPCQKESLNLQRIQHLGRMIYEVFLHQDDISCLPEKFDALSVVDESDAQNKSNEENSSTNRHPKLQRCKEKSLFSHLLEVGHYPVSVCRLMSDMIDIGIGGLADVPFTKVSDVIEDLQQMSSHPNVHLDNPEERFFSSNLRFGQSCYGNMGQVMNILRVASSLEANYSTGSPQADCAQCIFVSGIAGSGKTFLVNSVGDYLLTQGWIVLGAKFEQGQKHESLEFLSSAFDKLTMTLASMRDGKAEEDIEYSKCATRALSDALDRDSMSSLATFLPSIKELIGDVDENQVVGNDGADSDKDNSHWRLVFLLSSLLGAVLRADRRIMIYFDDLQWSDSTTLALLFEIVISMGRLPHARKRFLFVGMYRDNEVADAHHFTSKLDYLRRNKNVNIETLNVRRLSKNDISNMMMNEMRLPQRMIRKFARIIHKRTSGHALFVVELLNSLVRDSIVVYSPAKKRFQWDVDRLDTLQTWDSVANLIVSNLSTLSPISLRSLQILSCLGMSIHQSIINHLGLCYYLEGANDITSSIPTLMDEGIIETSDTIVKFCHDLIRETVYNGIAVDQRQHIHLCIGTFLGAKTPLGSQIQYNSIDSDIDSDFDKDEKENCYNVLPQGLVSIATDHINNASELVVDHIKRAKFAGWNLYAATASMKNSNWKRALYYFKNGIAYLSGQEWTQNSQQLTCRLYQGAAFTSLALGDAEEVPRYANAIVSNVPFEHSLPAQHLLIRSLECSGSKNQETVSTAIGVLRKLGFDIPSAPKVWLSFIVGGAWGQSPAMVVQRMKKTEEIASKYNLGELIRDGTCRVDKSKRAVLNILDSAFLACLRMRSPHLPFIICEAVNYSFEQGCACGESALAFAYFGYLKIWFEDDFMGGQRWGNMALKILQNAKQQGPFIRTRFVLYSLVFCWGRTLRKCAEQDLFETYELGMKHGDVATASVILGSHFRWLVWEGDKLIPLREKGEQYLKQIAKYNIEAAKVVLGEMLYIHVLTGLPWKQSFAVFDGMICDERSLLAGALSNKNRVLAFGIYLSRFFREFSMANYNEASNWAKLALPYSKALPPLPVKILFTVARGIIAFRMYREGKGEIYFNEGKDMLNEMEKWVKYSEHNAKNKFLMLEAEFHASTCEVNKAKEKYEASIRSARNYGRVNDQGLAYELMGDYLSSISEIPQAIECYKLAHKYYMQWGAVAKAEKIQKEQDLTDENTGNNPTKHERDW